MNRLLPPLMVFIVWIALWGELTWANAASGVVVVAFIGFVIRPVPRQHRVNPVALVGLLGIFAVRLVTSSAAVVLTVLAPNADRLRSGVVAVRLRTDSLLVATIVADAISLTPGTLTLDARPAGERTRSGETSAQPGLDTGDAHGVTLYIHVLGLSDPDDIRTDVAGLERRVLAAVTPVDFAPDVHDTRDGSDRRTQR
ncbi:MAG: Na+/H+ antiporter subunit E [Microthrixaceae bacterium]